MESSREYENTADTAVPAVLNTFDKTKSIAPILTHADAVKLAACHPKFPLRLSLSSSSSPSLASTALRMVSLLPSRDLDVLLSAEPLHSHRYMRFPCVELDGNPTLRTAYRVAMLYSALSESTISRLHEHHRLQALMQKSSCPVSANMKNRYHRAFFNANSAGIGLRLIRGGWCLGGIIATPFVSPSTSDSNSDGNSNNNGNSDSDDGSGVDLPTIYSTELACAALLLDQQLVSYPEKRLARRPFGALVINFTQTHVRLLEAVVNDPLEPSLSMTLHKERPFSPLPSDPEMTGSAVDEWRDVLGWCLFINKPSSEVVADCLYEPCYFPPGLTPLKMPKKTAGEPASTDTSSAAGVVSDGP